MQDPNIPLVRDLILIGGGHTHALVLRMWAMNPLAGVRLTLINPDPVAPYTGMLPGLIAGHYTSDEIMIDLVRLARFAGARLILDSAIGIDRDRREILLQNRPPLPYDLASIDIGITSDLPGFTDHAVSAKPLGSYAAKWAQFVARALPTPNLVIIGGGIAGFELALASAHRLCSAGAQPKITVLHTGPVALPTLSDNAREKLLQTVAAYGITVLTNAHAASADDTSVTLADGIRIPSDLTLTAAGARPHPWLATTGLALHDGFVTVSETLQSSDPQIFAIGDCAHLSHAPRPKAGVFAVRAAPTLLHNLRATLTETALRPFHPQKDYLKLISLGSKSALADRWSLQFSGPWLWRLKDRIDRKFMAKFETFPAMPLPALPAPAVQGLAGLMSAQPLCGGCGAKVGPSGLAATLNALPRPTRADVISGPGDDAAQIRFGNAIQVITTDHLRTFTCDPRLMARITATHALGDIWAMGAAPQTALAQITLPRLSPELQSRYLAEIMEEAARVFTAAGADIVGGHTSIGAELTIGFTVTGLTQQPITKAGAKPGDVLILTKAIGNGTIMAAEMATARVPGLLIGQSVAAAFIGMSRPSAAAAATLAPAAHA
ncbi:MAG: selenide, water dikinase SelD, partial [Paracoccaceae bacterium]